MTLLGKKIKLTGKTQKGKNRVRENGNDWVVLAETDRVIFSDQIGPWLFIAPEGKGQNDKQSRWIKADGDFDFQMTPAS